MKIKGHLPIFDGFFGTVFDADGRPIDTEIQYHSEQTGRDIDADDLEIDYRGYEQRVAKACVQRVQKEIIKILGFDKSEFSIKFDKVHRPRYYKSNNDSIDVLYHCSEGAFDKIVEYINTELVFFEDYIKHTYSDNDGFVSLYSNDSQVWLKEYLKIDYDSIDHCFGAVLDFVLRNEEYTEDVLFHKIKSLAYLNTKLIEK